MPVHRGQKAVILRKLSYTIAQFDLTAMLKRFFTLIWLTALLGAAGSTSLQAQCPSVGGQVTGGTTLCAGNPSPVLRLTGYDGTVVRWERSTNNGLTWLIINNTAITYTPPAVTQPTLFRAVVRKGFCAPANSLPARIDISAVQSVGGTISIASGNDVICSPADVPTLRLTGQVGNVVRWEGSTNGGATWSPIAITTTTYRPSQIAQTTLYRAVVQSGTCSEAISSTQQVVVAGQTSAGSVTGTQSVCEGNRNSFTLSLINSVGSVVRWERITEEDLDAEREWTTISNTTRFFSDFNLTKSTWFRAVVQSGICPPQFSAPAVITVLPASEAGTLTVTGDVRGAESFVCIGPGRNSGDVILRLNGQRGSVVRWEYRDGTDEWPYLPEDDEDAPTGSINFQGTELNLRTFDNGRLLDLALEGRAFRAIVRNNPCESDTTDGIVITFEGNCCVAPDPSTISLVDVIPNPNNARFTSLQMDLKWAPPARRDPPSGYRVQYRAVGTPTWGNVDDADIDVGAGGCPLKAVQDGVCYEVRIGSVCEDTENSSPSSDFSEPVTVCACAPVAPEDLTAVVIDDNTVELSWFYQSRNAEYVVFYRPQRSTENFLQARTNDQKITISGLEPGTEYQWFVLRLCFDGLGYTPILVNDNLDFRYLSEPGGFTTTGTYPVCTEFNYRWAVREGSSIGNDFNRAVTSDNQGFVYVLGEFQGTAQIGSYTLSSTTPGKNDLYVAKYDDNGTVIWATRLGSASDRDTDGGSSITVDPNGNVFVTGKFSGGTSFGPTVLTSAGGSDIFVVRMRASDGAVLWARSAGGPGDDAGYGVDYDDFGNLLVVGSVTGTASFGSQTLTGNSGQTDFFVAKYTNGGTPLWVRRGGNFNAGPDIARSVTVDAEGNAYVTGAVDGSSQNPEVNIGNEVLQNNTDDANAFVAKYDPDGTVIWAGLMENAYSEGTDIELDNLGNLYVSGYFARTLEFGADRITSVNRIDAPVRSIDGMLAKLATDGQPQWIRRISSPGDDVARSLAVDDANNIYVAGYFTGPNLAVFNNNTPNAGSRLANSGFETSDIFVYKFNANGVVSGARSAGSPDSDDAAYGITVTSADDVYAVGDFRSTATFRRDATATIELTAQSSGWDAFVAQLSCVNKLSCDIPPTNVFVSNIDLNTVSVSWDAVDPASVLEYEVRYRPLNSQTWEPTFRVPAAPALIRGIFANTQYEVQVRTICDPTAGAQKSGASLYTRPVRFETRTITECPVPVGLVVDNVFLNAAVITWNVVPGAARYVVSWRNIIGQEQWNEAVTTSNFFTIGGLAANNRYEVRVRSLCTQELESPFTLPVRFSTLAGSCLEPQGVATSMITPNSAMVTWLENTFAQSYQVQWRRVGSQTWSSATVTTTSYLILNLLSETEYEFRVRTVCGALNETSPYTPRQFFTTSPVCQIPAAVIVLERNRNRAVLSWTTVPGAVGYDVDYKLSNQVTWTRESVTTNVITLTGLQPNASYDVRVRTNCGNGNVTGFTPTRNFTTESFCEAPVDFRVVRSSVTSIALTWNGPSNAVGYTLEYRPIGGEWSPRTVLTSNFFEATSLLSDFSYEFRVYTNCADGSASDWATTIQTTPRCAPPTNIQIVNVTTNSARTTWTAIPGVLSYDLYLYSENDQQNPIFIERNIDASSFELTNLIPGQKYTVRLTVDCGSETSQFSAPVEFTTRRVCQTPTNVRVVEDRLTDVAAPIIWDAVDGAVAYVVFWKRNDETNYQQITVQSNTFVLGGLRRNTEYVFYVRASCGDANLSDPSADVFFRTREGSVGCFSPAIGSVTAGRTSATVSWTFVPTAIQYTVSWRRLDVNPPRWINVNVTDPSVTNFSIQNLVPGVDYEVRVRARCATEVSEWSQEQFRTQSGREAIAAATVTSWEVYPNPNNGQFQVSFDAPQAGTATLNLADVNGRSILRRAVEVVVGPQHLPIIVDSYAAGVYFLTFELNGQRIQQKLILN
jgi:hypothetical protein